MPPDLSTDRLVSPVCCATILDLASLCPEQEGLLALWRGWLPSVIGVIPYVGLNFAVYETSKDMILKHYGEV